MPHLAATSDQILSPVTGQRKIDVSIILACYNAASYVEESFKQIEDVLKATIYCYELIFVDDKSNDATVSIVKKLIQGKDYCRLYVHEINQGRGKTVHNGLMKARGEIIGFIDLDLDNPARYMTSMILGIRNNRADVCTALRVYRWKFNLYFFIRLLLSKGYAKLSSALLQTYLKDTETGCKFFRRDKIIPILEQTQEHGWFWDTELMTRAYYGGLVIREIPTLFIRNTFVSTVDLLPETFKYLYALFHFLPVKNKLRRQWLRHEEKANLF